MARKERQYAVECLEKVQHGRYEKEFYFGLYVPAFSKKDAQEVALEMVAGMTLDEIKTATVDKMKSYWDYFYASHHHRDPKQPVGFEFAEEFFTYRAYIE